MSQLAAYLSGLDWSPLLISLKTGIVATIISFFSGIYAARKVVKAGPRVKAEFHFRFQFQSVLSHAQAVPR